MADNRKYKVNDDYFKINPFLGYLFYPKKNNTLLSHGPKWTSIYYFDRDFKKTDNLNLLQYYLNFRNRSSFRLTLINEYVELLAPFDPTGTGKPELPAGSKHHWNALRMNYGSKPQSMFTYSIGGRVGGYYQDGSWSSINNELGYRFQPYVSLSSVISYNNISMPAPWNTTDFWDNSWKYGSWGEANWNLMASGSSGRVTAAGFGVW